MTDAREQGRDRSPEATLAIIDPAEVRVRHDARGQAELVCAEGTVYKDVRVVPAFPITRPKRFVYFQDQDGNDLGVIVDPRRLDRESRDIVLDLADQAYFMPRITRILRIEEQTGMGIAKWHVETDRGGNSFEIVSRSESVWYVGKNRVVIRDVDGNRYLIEDLSALDKRSRQLTDLYL